MTVFCSEEYSGGIQEELGWYGVVVALTGVNVT
jgi:hypothetical protein